MATSKSKRLNDSTKLYIYPSKESTHKLRQEIKELLNAHNSIIPIEHMIKRVNHLVCNWSNYFLPNPNQYVLRRTLDYYINKRSLK